MTALRVRLPEPFDLDLVIAAVRSSSFGTPFYAVGPDRLRRLLHLGDRLALADFAFDRRERALQVEVSATDSPVDPAELQAVTVHLWGLADPLPDCHAALAADPLLQPLLNRYAGLRLIRAASLYEALLSAVLGQQISVASAQAIRRRLMGALGENLVVDGVEYAAYPSPGRLLEAGPEGLQALGITRQKARYLLAVAQQAAGGALEPARFVALSDQEAIARLCTIPGIGRWTAEVGLMYGLGRLDIWFAGDLAVQTAVQRLLGRPTRPSERELRLFSDRWAGWRSYAALYLLTTLKETP